MKNKELIVLWTSLNAIGNSNTCIWYGIYRNKTILKPIVDEILEAKKAIVLHHCKWDNGAPVTQVVNGLEQYVFDSEEYENKCQQLINEWAEEEYPTEIKFIRAKLTAELLAERHSANVLEPLLKSIIDDANVEKS